MKYLLFPLWKKRMYYFSVYLHTVYSWHCVDSLLSKENVDVPKYVRSFSDWMYKNKLGTEFIQDMWIKRNPKTVILITH
jgi:hypothetical protein